MTRLFEKAIAEARKLSDREQDELAVWLLSMTDKMTAELDEETIEAIREGVEQARRGEFVSDEKVEALWRRHGL